MSRHTFFHNKYLQKKGNGKKGVFGGDIKSKEEVRAIHKNIKQYEEKEFESFEKEFDEQTKDLWQ